MEAGFSRSICLFVSYNLDRYSWNRAILYVLFLVCIGRNLLLHYCRIKCLLEAQGDIFPLLLTPPSYLLYSVPPVNPCLAPGSPSHFSAFRPRCSGFFTSLRWRAAVAGRFWMDLMLFHTCLRLQLLWVQWCLLGLNIRHVLLHE